MMKMVALALVATVFAGSPALQIKADEKAVTVDWFGVNW